MLMVDYTCNAVVKRGGKVLICEKLLGHVGAGDLEHQAGEVTWLEEPW